MSDPAQVVCILVAAGRGTRMGEGTPKQFRPLAGAPLLAHALSALSAASSVDRVVLVVPPDDTGPGRSLAASFPRVAAMVPGGATRRDSVAAGLEAAGPEAGLVLVHDAARPLATPALFEAVIASARRWGAAVPGLPVTDTVKRVRGEAVERTVPRENLVTVQTPQAFRAEWLRRAHRETPADAPATDDAAMIEALGLPVRVVPGESRNIKVTSEADLSLAEHLLAGLEEEGR